MNGGKGLSFGQVSKKKIKLMSIFMSLIMLFSLITPVSLAKAETITLTPDGNGKIDISENGDYYISGVGVNINQILVYSNVTANITFDNVTVDAEKLEYVAAVNISSNSAVNITLKGENTILGAVGVQPGIKVENNGILEISSDSTGILNAYGGQAGGAGIGGVAFEKCGKIIINGGTIYSTPSGNRTNSVGIGGGVDGELIINGGIIDVTGGIGAGIGAANMAGGWDITINGGDITAKGSWNFPGIGDGAGYRGEKPANITINGGKVTSTGIGGGAGIGSGINANGCNIKITGGFVNANTDRGYGIGDGRASAKTGIVIIDGGSVYGSKVLNPKNSKGEVVTSKLFATGNINKEGTVKISDDIEFNCITDAEGKLNFWLPSDEYSIYFICEGIYYDLSSNKIPSVEDSIIDISKGNIIIGDNILKGKDSEGNEIKPNNKGYKIISSEESTTNTIEVVSGEHNIILSDVNINSSATELKSAFAIKSDAVVNLTLEGINKLVSGAQCAGLQVSEQAKLIINGSYDDELTAIGGEFGAGIGGYNQNPENKSTIDINGGKILAYGGRYGAGIGTGASNALNSSIAIKISNGDILAIGGADAAGIGGGYCGTGGKIQISGGNVEAKGNGSGNFDIGSGLYGYDIGCNTVINGGSIKADRIQALNDGSFKDNLLKNILTTGYGENELVQISYNNGNVFNCKTDSEGKLYLLLPIGINSIENGNDILLIKNGDSFINNTKYELINLNDKNAVINEENANSYGYIVTCNTEETQNNLTVSSGEHNILLWNLNARMPINKSPISIENNSKVKINIIGDNNLVGGDYKPAIEVNGNAEVTIDGTEKDKLIANGGANGAGIGSGIQLTSGNINILGGEIIANGGANGAGIGSGYDGTSGNIAITGGKVTANGGDFSSGIGSGRDGIVGSITITGGEVIAKGGYYGAGIGRGYYGTSDEIKILGGIVSAIGGDFGLGCKSTTGEVRLKGDAILYTTEIPMSSILEKGIVYTGVSYVDSTLQGGIGTIYGNPNIVDFAEPTSSKLGVDLSEINEENTGITALVEDVFYTGKEVLPRVTIDVNKIALKKTLVSGEDFEANIIDDNKTSLGEKALEISAIENSGNINSKNTNFNVTMEKLYGHSLSLSGNIGVNMYMELSEAAFDEYNDAYMLFTLPNGKTKTIKVSEAQEKNINDKKYYVFGCSVNTKEMSDIITAQIIYDKDTKGKVYTYSVDEYINKLLNSDKEEAIKAKNLVTSMRLFGYCSEAYFDNKEVTIDQGKLNEVTRDSLNSHEAIIYGTEEGITYAGSSLILDSETTIRHYFKVEEGYDMPSFTLDNEKTLTPLKKGNLYYVEIPNILAHNLDKMYKVNAGGFSIEYSALSYGYKVLESNSETVTEKLKNLVKAMYLYNIETDEYSKK